MVGYRVENSQSFKALYKCLFCNLLLRDPVQLTDCGHRVCQSCTTEQLGDVITCPECHDKTSRERLRIDRGFRSDMQTLLITCSLCDWTDELRNYEIHLSQTHSNPLCKFCNKQFPSVTKLDQHIVHECDKVTVYCPLKSFGCEEEILRVNLKTHYLTDQHQIAVIHFILQQKSNPLICTNNYLTSDSLPTRMNVTNLLEEPHEMIEILSAGIETLNDDTQRVKNEYIQYHKQLQLITHDSSTLKKSVEEQNVVLDHFNSKQEICEKEILMMKQKLDNAKLSSYDGTLLWKITNVKEKIDDAQSNRQTSIDSSPFYSSSTGYKMCLRMYLDGDGSARRTHLSLFFVLMRGKYDAILKFPFCFKIVFCLYDQTEKQQHIIDSFRPDMMSNSFYRPQSDMNLASGLPKFAPLTIFQQENNPYVRDDTMFIKVIIDFNRLPNSILPYVFSISPKVPTQLQQTMIREEMEKQQQTLDSLKMGSI